MKLSFGVRVLPKCEICGAPAKKPEYFNTEKHINSQRHQKALKRRSTTPLKPSQQIPSAQPSLTTTQLEPRINALESAVYSLSSKVDFLIEEFAAFQKKIPEMVTRQQPAELKQDLILEIMDDIKRIKTSKGSWITIDDLFSSLSLKPTEWPLFQATVIKMFDQDLIDLIDGTSRKKLNMRGRVYGLIRRK